ncbi:type IV pilus biogenesis protein PilN [Burkholderia aenigmatica]|uniref:Type IV pilus biogenesis protein PilN n=1 Tax=Burkholderia aenigmatica TaxID=2015348 RepID=A0A6P2NRE7_9BURK|nr:secretin N-terminal domain-containing protein [Burkholderia aenigmatica]VWB97430.1 type IV pilus biogenesis protein PilN [Burkholderia aenigmatica]
MQTSNTQSPGLSALPRKHLAITISALLSVAPLAGCGTVKNDVIAMKAQASGRIAEETEKQAQPLPVVTRTQAAWLLGEAVPVVAPPPAFLSRTITYNPRQLVTLTDIAAYISQTLGIRIDTSEVWSGAAGMPFGGSMAGATSPTVPAISGAPSGNSALSINGSPAAPQPGAVLPGAASASAAMGMYSGSQYFSVDYSGKLRGLLDIAASKSGVWWKYVDGRGIIFYRSETKTFYLPALANKSTGGGKISANSNSSGAGTSSSSPSSSSSSGGGGGISSMGGSNASTEFEVDIWGDLKKTAETVAAGGKVDVNPSAGSVTVTGTPTQVRNIEEWIKPLTDNLSQQVQITLDVFTVKVKAEENYNWNPSVVFKSLSGKWGVNLTGPQAPAIVSGTNPLNLTASILSTATGGLAQFSGSQFAYNALSSLGDVAQVMHQTVVTLNGRPAPMQMADIEGYLASQTPSASVAVGATPLPPSLTPGSLTTGFTATFIPKVVNGKIFLAMDMTSSNNNGFGQAGTSTSFIQTPNYSQNTFQQSAMLTPGASLMLTSVQQHNGKSNRNGVGTPSNFAFGGGLDDSTSKQLTAIVITAKVL